MPFVVGAEFADLPDWYKDIVRSIIEQSEALRKQPYPVYDQPRVAGLPPFLSKSYELAKGIGKHEPYYQQAEELLKPSNLPYAQQLLPYMNPYLENVVENIGKKGKKAFTENILPALEAKFLNLGQHGSSRHKDLSLRAARDLEEAILEKQKEALSQGFERAADINYREKLRNIEAARSLGNLGTAAQSSSQQDVNLLNTLGAQQQAHRQQELNEQQAEFWRRMMWPHQVLQQQVGTMSGIPSPVTGHTTMSYEPPTPVPQVNAIGQIGGMAAQLYGMGQLPRAFKKGGRIKTPKLSSLKFRKKSSFRKGII